MRQNALLEALLEDQSAGRCTSAELAAEPRSLPPGEATNRACRTPNSNIIFIRGSEAHAQNVSPMRFAVKRYFHFFPLFPLLGVYSSNAAEITECWPAAGFSTVHRSFALCTLSLGFLSSADFLSEPRSPPRPRRH